jgi:glyoxylase-like metal-dependent hydrolase (beta-lactamase superfamily II)
MLKKAVVIIEEDEKVQLKRIEIPPYGTNAYVIVCRSSADSVLVDAPGEVDLLIKSLEGTNPRYILMTHGHFDHIGALENLKARLQVPVAAHTADSDRLPVTPDTLLNNGDTLTFGSTGLKVLHTPGHTPGSLCFLLDKILLSGDTLFPHGPGKTSSPAAFHQIVEAIKTKILPLPDDTQIFPGHGDSTILKNEKEEFSIFSSRLHSPNLCGDVLWLSS